MQQYWKVSDLLVSALVNCPQTSVAFHAASEAFVSVGGHLLQLDPNNCLSMFMDFSLQKLAVVLSRNTSKRLAIMTIVAAFTPPNTLSKVQAIKKLQALISDTAIFINCLTMLATAQRSEDEMLHDLYAYYAGIGMGMHSPKIRSSAISLLCLLVPKAVHLLVPITDSLIILAKTESWWEVKVQLLRLCGLLLDAKIGEKETPEMNISREEQALHACLLTVCDTVFTTSATRAVKLIGLNALAKGTAMNDYNQNLTFTGRYVDVLLSLPLDDQKVLLGLSEEALAETTQQGTEDSITLKLPTTTGPTFTVFPITRKWAPESVMKLLVYQRTTGKLEEMSIPTLQLYRGCVMSASMANNANNDLGHDFVECYEALKESVFRALQQEDAAESVVGIISCYILSCSHLQNSVLSDPYWQSCLKELYATPGSSASACQGIFEDFLRDLWSCGHPFNGLAQDFLRGFAKNTSSVFEKSMTLQKLAKDFA
jgi:hypothetical protein